MEYTAGLTESELKIITDFLLTFEEIEMAKVFASRAIGSYKEASDIDIALFGKNVTQKTARDCKFDIEEDSYLPYFIDAVSYADIKNDELKQHIDTVGVTIYRKGWRECKLGEIAFINPTESLTKGFPAKKIAMELLMPFSKRVKGYSIEPYTGGMKFRNGDTIIARITPCLENGKTAFIDVLDEMKDEVGFGSTEYIVFREKEGKSDKHFLYYFAISDAFRDVAILAMSGSSGRQRVEMDVVKNHKFLLPPLPEQKAIAAVLSSLDDKIDLLHRQNKTLESMAETLFRQWFVEEADEGWEVGKLPDEFDFIMGQSPEGTSFNKSSIGTPMFQGNADFGFRFPSERVYTTAPTRFAEAMDILISVRAPVGAQNMALKRCCIGRGVSAFRYKKNKSYYTYTFFKLRSLMTEIKQFNNEGTIFGSIGKTDFEGIEIQIPPTLLIDKFENTVTPMNDKVIKNCIQIRTLEKLRNILLPKLMSGEVRVEI